MGCYNGVYIVFLEGLENESGEMSLFFCVLLWIKGVAPVLLADSREYSLQKTLFLKRYVVCVSKFQCTSELSQQYCG